MRKYAADNLMFLREHYNSIYHIVRNRDRQKERYAICETRIGLPNVRMNMETAQEVHLYSKYNPVHEVERWAESIGTGIVNKKYVLIYGFGLGYHIQKFIEWYPDKLLYILEPDLEMFLTAIEAVDLRETLSHANIRVFAVGSELAIREELLQLLYSQAIGECSVITLPVYNKLNGQLLAEFQNDIQRTLLTYQSNAATASAFNKKWLENTLRNLPINMQTPPATGLKDTIRDVPAVIVGSGPSLKNDIDVLRELKNHALIIAAGSSIQALLHHGIEPHLIVSMDAGEANYRVFQKIDVSSIPMLYVPLIHSKIVKECRPNMFHAYFDMDTVSQYHMFDNEPAFFSTGSVTGTAIQAAVYFGCRQIVFMGQDLSYPNETYYTEGVTHISQKSINRFVANATELVENVQGSYNKTAPNMKSILEELEGLLNTYPDVVFVNTSKMGAKIKHTVWMDIKEVLEQFQHISLESDWFLAKMRENLKPYSHTSLYQIKTKVESTMNQLGDMGKRLHGIADDLRKLKNLKTAQLQPYSSGILDIQNKWGKVANSEIFEPIFGFVLKNEINTLDRHLPEIVSESNVIRKAELIGKHLGELVEGMIQLVPKLKSLYQEVLNDINTSEIIS